MVKGSPTRTNIPVVFSERRYCGSLKRAAYCDRPMKLTLNGVLKSLDVMSVKDMISEERRGISMKMQKTRANGRANPHATRVRRRRMTAEAPPAPDDLRNNLMATCPSPQPRLEIGAYSNLHRRSWFHG